MPTIAEIRHKYPQYNDMSDSALAGALHRKFYSDVPESEFMAAVGLASPASPEIAAPDSRTAQAQSFFGGAVEGLPIVGPAFRNAADYISAGIVAPFTDKSFQEELEIARKIGTENEQANPITHTVGEVTGAIVGAAPMVAAAPSLFGAGGAPLAVNMLTGGASGAALGGADAAVRSSGDLETTKEGAMWGGALGAVGPVAGRAAGKVAGWAANKLHGPSAAEKAFGRAVSADSIDDVAGRLAALGPEGMAMDLGPNLQRQAGALAGQHGRAQEGIRSAISERQANAGARVASALDDALGQPVDTIAMADDIIAKRSGSAKPLYDAAYSKPVPYSGELEMLLTRPSMRKALAKAQTLAADEGIASKQWFAHVANDGTISIRNVPDVRQLDLTKRALDDMVSAAQRAGNANEARILMQQRDLLLKAVDSAVPEYASARKAFSGPSAILDTLEDGRAVFSNKMTPNELRTKMMKMDEGQREAFIQGGRAAIADVMGTARNDAAAARALFDKGYNREKLSVLIGKERAARLIAALDAEKNFSKTSDIVSGNSETFARASAANELGVSKSPGVFRSVLNMQFGDAITRAVDSVVAAFKAGNQAKVNEELARLLSSGSGEMASHAIAGIQDAARRGDLTSAQAEKLIQTIAISAPMATFFEVIENVKKRLFRTSTRVRAGARETMSVFEILCAGAREAVLPFSGCFSNLP